MYKGWVKQRISHWRENRSGRLRSRGYHGIFKERMKNATTARPSEIQTEKWPTAGQ